MSKAQELSRQIDMLNAYRTKLRKRERSLNSRDAALSSQIQVPNSGAEKLRGKLLNGLPTHLMPYNVGGLNQVVWPFWYRVRFTFENLAQINNSLNQRQFFQVTQEAGFVLTHITQNFLNGDTPGGGLAPWQVEFRDRQSSRQLNNEPIPVQSFGSRGLPMELPTPFLIMPNAAVDVTLTNFAPAPYAITAETVVIELEFHGLRMRIDEADKVLSTIYELPRR